MDNWIRGMLALMVLIGCASTHVQNVAVERQLEQDKAAYAMADTTQKRFAAGL